MGVFLDATIIKQNDLPLYANFCQGDVENAQTSNAVSMKFASGGPQINLGIQDLAIGTGIAKPQCIPEGWTHLRGFDLITGKTTMILLSCSSTYILPDNQRAWSRTPR
jgi:hypothetical protein